MLFENEDKAAVPNVQISTAAFVSFLRTKIG